MDIFNAEQLNSIIFGLAVMVLVVATVLVIAALVVKLRAARTVAVDREQYAALLRRYEELSGSTAAALHRHATEVSDIRSRLTQIEQTITR